MNALRYDRGIMSKCSSSTFFFLFITARDKYSSFGRESLMMLSVQSFVCITETRDSNAVQQTSQEFSFDGVRFIRMFRAFPKTELTIGYTCVCSVFRGSLYIIEPRTREFSFGTLVIRVAGRVAQNVAFKSRVSRLPTFSKSFSKSCFAAKR